MDGFFGKLNVTQCGQCVVISRTATVNDNFSAIAVSLSCDNGEAWELESQLRELRLARVGTVDAIHARVAENALHRNNVIHQMQEV
jgi:hypothetical protein